MMRQRIENYKLNDDEAFDHIPEKDEPRETDSEPADFGDTEAEEMEIQWLK